jgi:hypothetical protein
MPVYVTSIDEAGYRLSVVRDDRWHVHLESNVRFHSSIAVSPDGQTVAVAWRDLAFTFWTIDRSQYR